MKDTRHTIRIVLVLGGLALLAGCSDSSGYLVYVDLPAEPQDYDSEWAIPAALKTDTAPPAPVETTDVAAEETPTEEVNTKVAASNSEDSSGKPVKANGETRTDTLEESESGSDTVAVTQEPEGPEQVQPTISDQPADVGSPLPEAMEESEEPLEIKLLIAEKRFREEDNSLRVSYDDIDLLKILNMQPVPVDADRHFPEWLRGLDGKKIRIRGFMYPTFEATGLTRFSLARDNGICCFVRQPKVYDIIGVDLIEGETTDYIDGKPFDVEGVFQIAPEADDTELYQLYRIADATVLK